MAENKKTKVVLLDAHAIIHRAYHALPDFSSSNTGEPTGALYGLVAMLLKIVQELKPDYLFACYDLPEPTYRHEAYDNYKAGRIQTDDDLATQLDRSRDIFEAFAIPIYEKSGYEADDLIGTLAEDLKNKKDFEVVIASGDMDTLQLVDKKKVTVYTLKKGIKDTILYDEKAVTERFGFKPELLVDYKGLRGDPSDNIIGIAGIGEKTATTLITTFGSIESIYKTLKESPEKFKEAGLSDRIVKLLTEGEEEAVFSKELATIHKNVPVHVTLPKKRWHDAVEQQKVLDLFNELGFRTLSDRVRSYFGGEEESTEVEVSEENETEEDIKSLSFKEAQVAVWLLNSDITNPTAEDILQMSKQKTIEEARTVLFEQLKKEGLWKLFEEIEQPLIPIVEKMHERGVSINTEYLKELSKQYHKELDRIENDIFEHAGEEFNVNSPKQLSEILFDKLGLSAKNHKKTGTGQRSTRESELEKMRDSHPIIADILSYRELQKLLSTYIDNIPGMVEDGRLHAQFLQTGTTTGRMSSQSPNLQNIPIRSELGRAIRNAFTATEGFSLLTFDYSQIELRVAAFLSGDEKLINVFKEGGDVHTATASFVFNVPPDMVDKEMRRQAKVINFGILYGMGVNALRQNLNTDRATAQKFLSEYFKNYSGLAQYMERLKGEASRNGFTETLFGRKRYFEGLKSPIPYIRAAAERMAINAPIQGTEADIIKLAMVEADRYIEEEGLSNDVYLLLQVHDELVYEVRKDKEKEVIERVTDIMQSVLTLDDTHGVPLVVDAAVGPHWGEMKPL